MTAPETPSPSMLPLAKMRPGPNPRRYFDRKDHDDLVASFRVRGMIQPMLMRPLPGEDDLYEIVAGERRHRAALEAFGPDGEAPVIIREMSDQEALEAAIDENDKRADASETEQADAAVRVLAACGGDRAEAARRLAWSPAKLDRRLALANLSDTVKAALDERRIKVGHAELLAVVPGDKQDKALETILSANLDVSKTRELLMRVTQSLGAATFDKTECTTCPFNSGSQRALFETHVDDGHCTNPGCFQLKTEAAEKARAAEKPPVAEGAGATSPAPAPAAKAGAPGAKAGPGVASTRKTVNAASLAGRAADVREAAWRNAVALSLAASDDRAKAVVLIAAMSGTLHQIKAGTLTARAGVLVGEAFLGLDFKGKIAAISEMPAGKAQDVLSAIGAAYARDAADFGHVAELARAFEIDLRDSWRVDQAFLDRFSKDELKFIAQECGLVAHLGAKVFAKLLESKNDAIVAGMLNATGFDWVGRLPSAMTLDGQYGPPALPEKD